MVAIRISIKFEGRSTGTAHRVVMIAGQPRSKWRSGAPGSRKVIKARSRSSRWSEGEIDHAAMHLRLMHSYGIDVVPDI